MRKGEDGTRDKARKYFRASLREAALARKREQSEGKRQQRQAARERASRERREMTRQRALGREQQRREARAR